MNRAYACGALSYKFSAMPKIVSTTSLIKYREQWLHEGMELLKVRVFRPAKYRVTDKIRVSCGFPHTNAFGTRKRTLGECWYPRSNTPHELFITPLEAEPVRVLDILTHEVVHTVAGKDAKHGKDFKYVAERVGLTGKMTSTVAGPALKKVLTEIVGQLGDYPHQPMDPALKQAKPRNPSSFKVLCSTGCDYWLRLPIRFAEYDLPPCPLCGETMHIPLAGS